MANVSTHAKEKSTFKIMVTWTDANGGTVTPTSATWTLTRGDGSPVNSRTDVVLSPGSTNTITLSGNDLTLADDNQSNETLVLTIEAVSATLTFNDECLFVVDRLVGVS